MSRFETAGRRRWVTVAVGIGVIGVYAGLAAWSSHLTPLARGPLLDGLAPTNYRWVDPPPELASTNLEPSSGRFRLTMTADGVEGSVVFTSDNQVTVIVATGSIAPRPGEQRVDLAITPIAPATMSPPGGGLSVFGNAYRIEGTYRPSGDAVRNTDVTQPFDVILVYPSTANLHAATHQLLYSADGDTWDPIDSTDTAQSQQAEGNVPGVGTVVVAGQPSSASPAPAGSGNATLLTVVLLIAGCLLLVGIALVIRSRRT